MPEMRRAKSQVLFRYTPKAMFRYNETYGWCEVTSIEMRNTEDLSPALSEALWSVLHSWDAVQPDNYPDPKLYPNKYEVGEPYQVHYTLAPLVFTCKSCRRVQFYLDVDTLTRKNYTLRCRGCQREETLVQVPYKFIHECGRADTLFVPKHPFGHNVVMNNRGRFQESNWYCQTCNKPLTSAGKQGLGFRACKCGPRQFMRGSTLQDPGVQYTRTISLVDTQDGLLERVEDNASLGTALLAGLLQTPSYERAAFSDLLKPAPAPQVSEHKLDALREDLRAKGISDPAQLEAVLNAMQSHLVSPEVEREQRLESDVKALLGADSPQLEAAKTSRPLLEYMFVRDHPRMQAVELSSLLSQAAEARDGLAQERYGADAVVADRLGIAQLQLLEKFPLLLAAIGFSRVYANPQQNKSTTMLRPFIADRPKIPIYAVRSTTEAFMFELDPWREAAWLIENGICTGPSTPFTGESDVRLWMLRQREVFLRQKESHLELMPREKEQGQQVQRTSALLFGLLHSLSHMLIMAARTHVGFDADSLGEYLFPISGSGVIYATGHQQFTLGGIVSAFKMNLTLWLDGTYEAAQRCIFNPLCRTRGGACHACSHLRFSCPHFNRTQSRAFLVGGPVVGLEKELVGYWSPKVYKRAHSLKACSEGS
jgi:hypothetical protein